MLVYYGQTVGWIKMKLGMQVGLGSGHIVLHGDPSLANGAHPPIFSPCLLWPWLWIKMPLSMEVGLGPDDFVLGGDPAPHPQKGGRPQFSAHVYCGQAAGWIKMPFGTEVGLGPSDIVLDRNLSLIHI